MIQTSTTERDELSRARRLSEFPLALLLGGLLIVRTLPAAEPIDPQKILAPENLTAWCVVPFDAARRGPTDRAAMLSELGIRSCAYDWREEHVPELSAEIAAYQQQEIDFHAFWGWRDDALALFERHGLRPQIWLMPPQPDKYVGEEEPVRIQWVVDQLLPRARELNQRGFPLGLYNHGGWAGRPHVLAAVAEELRTAGCPHVGVIYNFHHAHDEIDHWPQAVAVLSPYLWCVNLNGMNADASPKILPIGQGQHEFEMLRTLLKSGYQGRLGVIHHRSEIDARTGLAENLAGLAELRQRLATDFANGTAEAQR